MLTFSLDPEPSLDLIRLSVQLGDRSLAEESVQFRAEVRERQLLNIVQVVSPAQVRSGKDNNKSNKGVLLDIDSIDDNVAADFWDSFPERLRYVHDEIKRLFFDILSPRTLERLEPEY